MSEELDNFRTSVGCAGAIIALLVSLPAWFYLLHFVLVATSAPDSMWVIYWLYVPSSFVGNTMALMGKKKA